MISLVAFDLDGTLAESKQALEASMSEALTTLLSVAHVAVISGGDWPQFQKQVASRMPPHADLSKLWLMPTTGTKLEAKRKEIIDAFNTSLDVTGGNDYPAKEVGVKTVLVRDPEDTLTAIAAIVACLQ
ncbi:hypothetical protein F5Y19DRAFT_481725 [Xylariaceae sp. FL1651]|nr:hypothetical protein F5Y19DRAFT_481725 [Xylariaceae sp. FL1651]